MNYENIVEKIERNNITNIITNDIDAWNSKRNKINKKIYNKLWLVESQHITCGPIGTEPNEYPIIIKPIINLYGMSRSFKKLMSKKEYKENQIDGCFWMPYYDGSQYTIDLVLNCGKIIGVYALESKPNMNGTFKYHKYNSSYILSDSKRNFIETNFSDYSGPMNVEIIDDVIIEGHLRFNGDMFLYDSEFLKTVSSIIDNDNDKDKDKLLTTIENFYLFPYFVSSNFNTKILDEKQIEDILLSNGVNNIRWDNIDSDYQKNDLKRLFMFKTDTYESGINIIQLIEKNLLIREHILNIYK
jgi:hypothetical protein